MKQYKIQNKDNSNKTFQLSAGLTTGTVYVHKVMYSGH